MKKILFYLALLTVLVIPAVSSASTVSLSTTGNYVVGRSYTVDVVVNPQTSKIYTSKVVVNFPAEILEARNFTFSNGWMPVSQSGYDLIDNNGGVVIKTAGYTSGLVAPTTMGTITFYAKKTGAGNISVASASQLLDSESKNVFVVSANVAVVVNEAPVIAPVVAPTLVVKPIVTAVASTSAISSATTTASSTIDSQSNTAAVGTTGSLKTGLIWLFGIVLALGILTGGYFLGKRS